MTREARSHTASPSELLSGLGLTGLTALMLATPELAGPGLAREAIPTSGGLLLTVLTWWLALSASAFTLGYVFRQRSIAVGLVLGFGTSLAELLFSGVGSALSTTLIVAVAVACAHGGASFGRALRRLLQLRPVPIER